MPLRIASYNVENLFSRAMPINHDSNDDGTSVLKDIARLNTLIARPIYSTAVKTEIAELLKKHDVAVPSKRQFYINEVAGRLFRATGSGANKTYTVTAAGRGDWRGWIDFERARIEGPAIQNTGRVIREVGADVLCLVEVEDRVVLGQFNQQIIAQANGSGGNSAVRPYEHCLLIDGNDKRGIDVGLLSRFPVEDMRTHVSELKANGNPLFPRDCPEYEVKLPDGRSLWVLPNHFTSKFGGASATNDRRREQAQRVREILERFDLRIDLVVVLGDFNDLPGSNSPLNPLLGVPHMHDVLNQLPANEPRWTYRSPKNQIDFLLVSKPLWDVRAGAGIFRRGLFLPNVDRFESIDSVATAASDHAAVWADFDL